MNFDEAFTRLLGNEGSYSNHPSDPGGETMFGITLRVARGNGYAGAMKDMPRETAKAIYRRLYWDAVQADQLPAILRFEMFDAAVNSGVWQATVWLQRALNVADDGRLGGQTLAAAHQANAWRTACSFNGQRLATMTELHTWPDFGRGWAARVARNLIALAAASEA